MKKVFLDKSNLSKGLVLCVLGGVLVFAGDCGKKPEDENPKDPASSTPTICAKGVEVEVKGDDGKAVKVKLTDDMVAVLLGKKTVSDVKPDDVVHAKDGTVKFKDTSDAEKSCSVADIIAYILEGKDVPQWDQASNAVKKMTYADLKTHYDNLLAKAKAIKGFVDTIENEAMDKLIVQTVAPVAGATSPLAKDAFILAAINGSRTVGEFGIFSGTKAVDGSIVTTLTKYNTLKDLFGAIAQAQTNANDIK